MNNQNLPSKGVERPFRQERRELRKKVLVGLQFDMKDAFQANCKSKHQYRLP